MSSNTTPMPSNVVSMSISDNTTHDISSMLERPIFLPSFTWSDSSPALPFSYTRTQFLARDQPHLQEFDFPQSIFENSEIAVDKLKAFQYMKADLEVELKFNPNPNLRGALMMVYKPYNNNMLPFRKFGPQFMASQTSFPHKIISMEEVNSVKMIVPYVNIYEFFDLGNLGNQFGTIAIYVFSPLAGTEAGVSIPISVNCRFINPDFRVPTQRDVLSSYQDNFAIERLRSRGKVFAESDSSPMAAPDLGEVDSTGPVAKAASAVATVSDILSGVPVIGKFASSVSWISRLAAQTATVFGWSKPTDINPSSKMVIKPANTLIHTEGRDDATTLALINDNGIDGSTFIPEDKDEMAFSHILGTPNVFHAVQADTTLFKDRKLITSWEVSPFSSYQYSLTGADTSTLYLGSFAYLSQCFATLWRGTIHYDIYMIKTCFHRGRFAVVFLPETNMNEVPATLGDLLTKTYNVVVSLQDRQDELGRTMVRFTIPYTANTPWRKTFNLTNGEPDASTLETKTGCIAIYSLTDLSVNPGIADPAMSFYIAHSGGEDYELGRPQLNLAPGFSGAYAESDHGRVFIPENEDLVIPSHTSSDLSAGTTGEYFKSLRQIIKRFGRSFNLASSDDYLGIKSRTFREQFGPIQTGTRNIGSADVPVIGYPTPWYMASFLYAFYNGSSQLKVFPASPADTTDAYLRFDSSSAFQAVIPRNDSIGQPNFQQLQQVSNCFEVRTPWYRAIRADVVSSNQIPVLGDVRTCVRNRNFDGNPAEVFEAAGDDFNFFFLRGPPPMVPIKQVNMPEVPTLPAIPTTYTLNTESVIVSLGGTPQTLVMTTNVSLFSPTPDPSLNTFYPVINDFTYTVTFTDGSSVDFPASTLLLSNNNGEFSLSGELPTSKTIDIVATQATFRAYQTVTFGSGFPTTDKYTRVFVTTTGATSATIEPDFALSLTPVTTDVPITNVTGAYSSAPFPVFTNVSYTVGPEDLSWRTAENALIVAQQPSSFDIQASLALAQNNPGFYLLVEPTT